MNHPSTVKSMKNFINIPSMMGYRMLFLSVHVFFRCSCCFQVFILFSSVHVVFKCSCCFQVFMLLSSVHVDFKCSYCFQVFTLFTEQQPSHQ